MAFEYIGVTLCYYSEYSDVIGRVAFHQGWPLKERTYVYYVSVCLGKFDL